MERKKAKTIVVVGLLALAGLAVIFLPAYAGDLEPSGPPAPTMKTLDEVEPRVLIHASDLPLTITKSNSYYLVEDIYFTDDANHAITIECDDVTIDLMGYTLKGPDSENYYGVYMNGRSNVEIRNGTVRNFSCGIYEDNGTYGRNHRVIGVRAVLNGRRGIYLEGKAHLVKDCIASDNGYSSESDVYGIYAGKSCTITGNKTYRNGNSAAAYVHGICAGPGCTVTGNTAYNNGDNAAGTCGIWASGGCTVTGNTVYSNGSSATAGYVHGISVGPGSTVSGNAVSGNGDSADSYLVYGIWAGEGSTITGNTSSYNGDSATGEVHGIATYTGSTVTGNTSKNNGHSAGSNVNGIFANEGSTVTGNTACNNGDSAGGNVFGIHLTGNCLVDRNTAYDNGPGAGSVMNILDLSGNCTFGTNHAP